VVFVRILKYTQELGFENNKELIKFRAVKVQKFDLK
jgi:hypothetical protein